MITLLSLAGCQRSAAERINVRSLYERLPIRRRLSILSSLAERENSILAAEHTQESALQRELALASAAKSVRPAKSSSFRYEVALSGRHNGDCEVLLGGTYA